MPLFWISRKSVFDFTFIIGRSRFTNLFFVYLHSELASDILPFLSRIILILISFFSWLVMYGLSSKSVFTSFSGKESKYFVLIRFAK